MRKIINSLKQGKFLDSQYYSPAIEISFEYSKSFA